MIKAGPNCFDNIKDLAVAECVRAILGAEKPAVAGGSDIKKVTLTCIYISFKILAQQSITPIPNAIC